VTQAGAQDNAGQQKWSEARVHGRQFLVGKTVTLKQRLTSPVLTRVKKNLL
jgi:hypothetical protein